VEHALLVAEPAPSVARIAAFLGVALDLEAMSRTVDPALHRVRSRPGHPASGRR
jgi:hypothetical protein